MNATLSLKEALEVLKKRYEKEYSSYDSFSVDFCSKSYNTTSTDWGGDTTTYNYYALSADIRLGKKIGNVTVNYNITKTNYELKDDLLNELNELFKDDEYDISCLWLPLFDSDEVNLDKEVSFSLKKKKDKTLVKKI